MSILRTGSSLRGLAEVRGISREVLRKRFHRSFHALGRIQDPLDFLPETGPLIAVIDALWFRYQQGKRYGCFIILLRPVRDDTAVMARIRLRTGKETRWVWESVFRSLPQPICKRIVALVSDGCVGMKYFAHDQEWHFQWCHVHLKRTMSELRGMRNISARALRRRITKLVYRFLETPDEHEAQQCHQKLTRLFRHPRCPQSIRRRLSVLMKHPKLLRTYRRVPHLNLPISTNSVECVNSHIRNKLTAVRGFATPRALQEWLKTFHRFKTFVRCRGYRETLDGRHRKTRS